MNKTKELLKDIENNELISGGIAYIEHEEYEGQFDVLWPDKPKGEHIYMVEYFSAGVCPEDDEKYVGWFSTYDYSGDYIRDAMKDIQKTEDKVKKLQEQYNDKIDVQFLDFNKGCEYGCAINIWVKKQE